MSNILVIDDRRDVHDFVKRALGAEHQIVTTDQVSDAVNLIFEHNIELVLMDVEMPGFLKGDQFSDVLKKSLQKKKPVKIVLFSTLDEYDLRERAEKFGADGYIHKTFNDKLLQLHVKKYLR